MQRVSKKIEIFMSILPKLCDMCPIPKQGSGSFKNEVKIREVLLTSFGFR